MSIVYPLLSVIHVFSAVVWAGWALSFFYFVNPAIQQAGQTGPAVMQRLMGGPVLKVLAIVPLLVVLSGLILYWFYTGQLNTAIILSWSGLAMTIGALAGIAAFAEGLLITGPTAHKMQTLGAEMAQAGGPPSKDKLAQMGQLQARMESAVARGTYFLIVAVIGMALGG